MKETQETIQLICENLGLANNLILILIIAIVVNITATIVKFILERNLKDRDRVIYKKNLIINKSIIVQEELYLKLDGLSLYGADETFEMLSKIQEIQQFTTKNRLYLDREMRRIGDTILDYYRELLTDFRKKDFKKEERLFEEYARKFNK